MKKLENMTINEIIAMVGANLKGKDIQLIFNYDIDLVRRFQQELSKIRTSAISIFGEKKFEEANVEGGVSQLEVLEALARFENEIDKYVFVLLNLYNSKRDLEINALTPREERKETEARMRLAIELLGNKDFTVIEQIIKGNRVTELKILNSTRVIQCVKNGGSILDLNKPSKKQQARFNQIQQEVGIENIVTALMVEDIMECSLDVQIGQEILSQVSWNTIQQYAESHAELDVEELVSSQIIPDGLESELYESPEIRRAMLDSIEQNYRYIDLNKLMMVAWQRLIYLLEQDVDDRLRSAAVEDNGDRREEGKEGTVNGIRSIIGNIVRVIDKGTEIYVDGKTCTVQDMETSLKRFKEGRYIRIAEIEDAKTRLLAGDTTFMSEDEQVSLLITFNEKDFDTLIGHSEENIFFLVDKGVIIHEIKDVLYTKGTCSPELFALINQKGILEYEEMLELFEAGIISDEMVLSIEDEETKQKIKDDTMKSIRELQLLILGEDTKPLRLYTHTHTHTHTGSASGDLTCEEISEDNDKSTKTLEKFVRYVALYKKINIIGKTEEEVAEASLELISSFEKDLNGEVLQGLYQFGIISLEVATDWGMDFTEMLSDGSIRPTDVKDLFSKKVISIDSIKKVLRDKEVSYEEKLDLIYSTFDGETEEEALAREELLDFLEIGEGHQSETKGATKGPRGSGSSKKSKEFITDPHSRWKLISLLDRDYSKKFLPEGKAVMDGHRVFLLPNLGKIVIERMYEKKAGRRVSAYGSATYILDVESFFGNLDDIIVDSAINRTFLRELSEAGDATKIIHSKYWGNAIKNCFGISADNQMYTAEEIAQIDEAIENVEKSRRER